MVHDPCELFPTKQNKCVKVAVCSLFARYAVYKEQVTIDPPYCWKGTVIHGFRRGSKELGIPTANLDPEEVGNDSNKARPGVYAGWASVGSDNTVYKMVLNIGW